MKEIYKDIRGYEGIYQVSNLGNVKSLERKFTCENQFGSRDGTLKERILKPSVNIKGYKQCVLRKEGKDKSFKIARLVAEAFIPNTESKPQVNHIDCNNQNNVVDNLEWNTNGENQRHAFKNGLQKSKLNPKQVRVIRHIKDCKPKMFQREVATVFNVSDSIISDIWNNKIWSYV